MRKLLTESINNIMKMLTVDQLKEILAFVKEYYDV